MTTRRSVYLYPDDLERLKVLKASYGLGTSAACRAGLALLLAHLQNEDRQRALDTTVGPIRRKEKEMEDRERYVECKNCGAVVQGRDAAHWWGRWHARGCPGAVIVEIERDDEPQETDQDYRLTTEDRTEQVNWLRELAGNIAANLGPGTAEELVQYALSREGRESWGIEIPQWFDAHDRSLLIQWVGESL